MQIPVEIVVLFMGAWLAINTWQCKEIISLKTAVAVIKAKLHSKPKRENDET